MMCNVSETPTAPRKNNYGYREIDNVPSYYSDTLTFVVKFPITRTFFSTEDLSN